MIERAMKLPGLIDIHVHMRDPGAKHKEDWDSGTSAALAGGFTTVLAMPNTQPPVTDEVSLNMALDAAKEKARCDYGQYLGAGPDNTSSLRSISAKSAGLKMYLDQTYGSLRLNDMTFWSKHFANWPKCFPIVVHAEGRTMAAAILLATLYDRPIHLAHVSTREEIIIIRKAKERGYAITCEVTPHHMFMTDADIPNLGIGRSEVRPRLATASDLDALWQNLDAIDCFASDHAPHTLQEKDGTNPPPGFPGLETALPLFSTAIHEGRMTWEQLVIRMANNPRNIFHLPEQDETWIEFDPDDKWQIDASTMYSRCAWTPFDGWTVRGRLRRVVLRGKDAFINGQVLAPPGYGKNVRN